MSEAPKKRVMIKERRAPFVIDEEKFSTQRLVTYILLLVFTATTANVLLGQDQAERSTIIQTVINFAMLAIGFWLGASKQAQDTAASASRIAESGATNNHKPIKADDVNVSAKGKVTVRGGTK